MCGVELPLELVASLFAHAASAEGANVVALGEADYGVPEHVSRLLSQPGAADALPSVDAPGARLELMAPGSLVRFRGMVQDMFDPEFYVGAWRLPGEPWRTTKYTEGAAVPESAETAVWERRVYYCVPVPGEAPWMRPDSGAHCAGGAAASPQAEQRDKRRRPDAAAELSMDTDVSIAASTPAASPAPVESKRVRAPGDAAAPASVDAPLAAAAAGLPADPAGRGFLLKLYGSTGGDLKLNDVVECVCVLCVAPEEAALFGAEFSGAEFPEEEAARNPPHSAVPRLHALLAHKAAAPGAPPPAATPEAAAQAASALAEAAAPLRQRCLLLLTRALGGDVLAAEYLLLHLVSRVHAREEPLAVGALSLNLRGLGRGGDAGAAAAAVAAATEVVAALAPRCVRAPLSTAALNAAPWAPHKDYLTGRLTLAPLQLAAGTHLVLDETLLQAGPLSAVGLRNVQALKQLMATQALDVDFQYYTMPLAVDIPVLVLSQFKSLLAADVALPLTCTAAPAAPAPDDAALPALRAFLAAARALPHRISPEVGAAVEADLVAARGADPSLGQEVFHRWLTLARLMAASACESTLSLAAWRRVREMEHAAAERLRAER